VTFLTLLRFHLRRHRAAFAVAFALTAAHQVLFLALFQFWRKNADFATAAVRFLPRWFREGFGFPIEDLSDPLTYEALYFMRPELRALLLLFGVTVSSASLAGEVGAGTGDLLFSHPLRRRTAVLSGATAAFVHLLALGAAILAGYAAGTAWLPMGPGEPSIARIAPAVAMAVLGSFAIVSTTFLFGAACANRAQAVGWSVAIVIVPMFLDFAALFVGQLRAVASAFPEHWYRPHRILAAPALHPVAPVALRLALIACAALAASAWIAERRDLAR
jgi:hypothetical protein